MASQPRSPYWGHPINQSEKLSLPLDLSKGHVPLMALSPTYSPMLWGHCIVWLVLTLLGTKSLDLAEFSSLGLSFSICKMHVEGCVPFDFCEVEHGSSHLSFHNGFFRIYSEDYFQLTAESRTGIRGCTGSLHTDLCMQIARLFRRDSSSLQGLHLLRMLPLRFLCFVWLFFAVLGTELNASSMPN